MSRPDEAGCDEDLSHRKPPDLAKKPIYQTLTKTLIAGCSKTLRYKAPEIPRSVSYSPVRRSDEG